MKMPFDKSIVARLRKVRNWMREIGFKKLAWFGDMSKK